MLKTETNNYFITRKKAFVHAYNEENDDSFI